MNPLILAQGHSYNLSGIDLRLELLDPQTDLAPSPPNCNSDSVFQNELDLSTIDPPSNRKQRSLEIIEIENQNLVLNLILIALLLEEP